MMNKNNCNWEVVKPDEIKDTYDKSLSGFKSNIFKFRSDLGYIYRGLCSCDDILNDVCFNIPTTTLLECSAYIKDFIELLEYYKNIGIF